jgi:hypothetical protein
MTGKGPKTVKGQIRRDLTGDGRMNVNTKIAKELGIKKKRRR